MARAWWYSILIPIFLLNSKKEAAWVSLRPISPAPSTRSQDNWLPFRRSHLSPAVLIRPTSQLKLHRWNPPLRWISLHPPLSNPPLEQKSNPPINLLLCPCHRPRQWHPPPPHSNLDLPNRYEDLFFLLTTDVFMFTPSLSHFSLYFKIAIFRKIRFPMLSRNWLKINNKRFSRTIWKLRLSLPSLTSRVTENLLTLVKKIKQ